jgi:hypothetical protein
MRRQIVNLWSVSQQEERVQVRKTAISTRRPRRTIDVGVARAPPMQGQDALTRAPVQVG